MTFYLIATLLSSGSVPHLHRIQDEQILFFTNFDTSSFYDLTAIYLFIDKQKMCEFAINKDSAGRIFEVDCSTVDCDYVYYQGTAGTKQVLFKFVDLQGEYLGDLVFQHARKISGAAAIIVIGIVVVIFAAVLIFALVNKFSKKVYRYEHENNDSETTGVITEHLYIEEIVPATSIRYSLQLERSEQNSHTQSYNIYLGARCIRYSLDLRRQTSHDEQSTSSRNILSEPFGPTHLSDKGMFGGNEIIMSSKRHANQQIKPTVAQMTLQDYARANSALEENILPALPKPQPLSRVRHIEDLETIPSCNDGDE